MKYNQLVNKILNEVIGPNAPGDSGMPVPQKDYRWPSGGLTPEMLISMDKMNKSPEAVKETVIKLLLQVDEYFQDNDKYWKPLMERILKENNAKSLTELLNKVNMNKLKSLANILLLAGKSILIANKHEKDVQNIQQLHKAVMSLFPQ